MRGARVRRHADLIGAGTSTSGTHRYKCRRSEHLKRAADRLDLHVESIVVTILARPDSTDLFSGPPDGQSITLHRQAAATRARLNELTDMFAAGEIDRVQVAVGTKRIRAELAEVEAALADLAAGTVLDGLAGNPDVAAVWVGQPVERKRAVIDALVTVTALPGKRGGAGGTAAFDASTVRVVEKGR